MSKKLIAKIIGIIILVVVIAWAAIAKFSGSSSSSSDNTNTDTAAQTQDAANSDNQDANAQASQDAQQAPAQSYDVSNEQTFGATDYTQIPTELMIPTVYLENNISKINSFNVASTVYKNYLVNVAALNDTPKAIDLLNELYVSLDNVKDAPKDEIVLFYIDTMRHLADRISRGLTDTSYTNGIKATQDLSKLSDNEKVQFLANLTNNVNQVTDNFFSENQFIGRQFTGLTQDQNTVEYQRYLNINREIKNQNEALIQYDQTCMNNYKTAGNVINCLQQKLTIAFAAIDMQLLSTHKVYLVNHQNEIDPKVFKDNMDQLNENFSQILTFNKQRFDDDAAKLK